MCVDLALSRFVLRWFHPKRAKQHKIQTHRAHTRTSTTTKKEHSYIRLKPRPNTADSTRLFLSFCVYNFFLRSLHFWIFTEWVLCRSLCWDHFNIYKYLCFWTNEEKEEKKSSNLIHLFFASHFSRFIWHFFWMCTHSECVCMCMYVCVRLVITAIFSFYLFSLLSVSPSFNICHF